MSTAALIVASISLALAMVAYWRSGGARDIQKLKTALHSELEALRTKERELVESATKSLAAAYGRSRRRLAAARESLQKLKRETVEGLEKQIKLALEQLEALTELIEKSAHAAEQRTISAARRAERAIASRVRRMQARVALIHAKAKATHARWAAVSEDFDRAERLLVDATEHLRDARETLRFDRADDAQLELELDAVRESLREAISAVRARAADVHEHLEQVLADSNRILSTLETQETREFEHAEAA